MTITEGSVNGRIYLPKISYCRLSLKLKNTNNMTMTKLDQN